MDEDMDIRLPILRIFPFSVLSIFLIQGGQVSRADSKECPCWVPGILSKQQGFDWSHERVSDHCGLKPNAALTEEK